MRLLFAFLAGLLLCAGTARAQGDEEVPPPVPLTPSDTAFVGSVRVGFQKPLLNLRGTTIYYTLDAAITSPSQMQKYEDPFFLDHSDTVRAIRVMNGDRSPVTTVIYRKARLPRPVARFGPRPDFPSSKPLVCTLEVNATVKPGAPNEAKPIQILYSLDGARPWRVYTAGQPIAITRTATLTAVAAHDDYDTSLVLSQPFRLLPQVARPVMTPATDTFTTRYQRVLFTSATPGARFLYTLHPTAAPDIPDSSVTLDGQAGTRFTVRVVATKADMYPSEAAVRTYVHLPKVDMPLVKPSHTAFTDTLRVFLTNTTPGDTLHYTLNGDLPTPGKAMVYDSTKGIFLDQHANLRVIARKAPLAPSDEVNRHYKLSLSPPYPNEGSQEFEDTLHVFLNAVNPKAQIVYTLSGGPGATFGPGTRGAAIPLTKDTTRLWARAYLDSVYSDTAKYVYVRNPGSRATPQAVLDPAGGDFTDSATVRLLPPHATASIYFTTDGTDPTPTPQRLYAGPIAIRSTTVLKAVAVMPGRDPSPVASGRYVLIPAPPHADPPGGAVYRNRVEVTLSPRSSGSAVRYKTGHPVWNWTWDNVDLAESWPPPGGKLAFISTTRLTAVTVSGTGSDRRMSEPVVLVYEILQQAQGDSLLPGDRLPLSGGYAVINKGAVAVAARVMAFDHLGAAGFKDPSHAVVIGHDGGAFPRVRFVKPAGQAHVGVYRHLGEGRAALVGVADTTDLGQPGTYFAAADTQAPAIAWVPQAPRSGDTASVVLRVTDNAQPLSLAVTGSGIAAPLALRPSADGTVSFTVRNPAGQARTLWFHAVAKDGPNQSRLPPSGDRYTLPQAWSKVSTPARAYSIGNPANPWDMVGIPVAATAALTVKQIKDDNDDPSLVVYTRQGNENVALVDGDILEPGSAYWFASRFPRPSLALSKLSTPAPDADGVYRIHLRPDWNLIANPSLDTLYWPSPRSHPDYSQFRVRGLHGYSNQALDWERTDVLEPWQGYWVWNDLPHDTLVALSRTPIALPLAAPKAATGAAVEIELDFGRSFPIRLGARSYGKDEVGVEDEPVLPAWSHQREAWSIRERERLMTDVVRFRSGEVMRWRLALKGAPSPGSEAPVRVSGSRLPAGYEAWAWSPRRNLKVRLDRLAAWSVTGPGTDTVTVLAGPSAKLAAVPELARAVAEVREFATAIRMGKGGTRLHLALPGEGLVEAELLSPAGRRLATVHSGRLGMGHYDLPVPRTGAGVVLLRVRVRGPAWSGERVHKLAP